MFDRDPGKPFDILIVGGGINGAGLARDAAGRGFSVALIEQHDLAAHTSSASTKLIHGGLRYLEFGELRLVREALLEREALLGVAPHLIEPLEFALPYAPHLRPAWMIRGGLFLYDHLARRQRLPGSRAIAFDTHPAGRALRPEYKRGFSYVDCRVDDSRLVALNAVDAAARGAALVLRARLREARPENGLWRAQTDAGPIAARAIVNATGPWVAETLRLFGLSARKKLRLVKGGHIVVRRLYEGDCAFILQNRDGRVAFVIPYEGRFTLIGTTEESFEGDPAHVSISGAEIDYLCDCVNFYLRAQISRDDVVWSYAGVRPLFDDGAREDKAVTRDYALDLEHDADTPPILSVYGGKITTYRKLAEHALEKVLPALGAPVGASWTAKTPLPGGDFSDFAAFLADFRAARPELDPALAHRLARAYGTRAAQIALPDMGETFGGGLTEAEVDYLVREEWARTADDILWRRSKLGLHLSSASAARLADYLAKRIGAGAARTLATGKD